MTPQHQNQIQELSQQKKQLPKKLQKKLSQNKDALSFVQKVISATRKAEMAFLCGGKYLLNY